MSMRALGLLAGASLLLSGCSQSEAPPEMKDAFKDAPMPQQKQLADEAMAAFEKKDYPTAVVNLQSLRTDQTLTVDQSMAVQEMMSRVQTQLAMRADAGDKQAAETLRMLQAMPRR